VDDTHDDYRGKEVGKVGNVLYQFFIPDAFQLIEKQGKENRYGKANKETVKVYPQGVPEYPAEIKGVKEPAEMLHPHKGAAPETPGRHVVPEGYLDAIHGSVDEDRVPEQRNQHHQVQIPVFKQIPGSKFYLSPINPV
jgi:hypothetical protein